MSHETFVKHCAANVSGLSLKFPRRWAPSSELVAPSDGRRASKRPQEDWGGNEGTGRAESDRNGVRETASPRPAWAPQGGNIKWEAGDTEGVGETVVPWGPGQRGS